MVLNQVRGVVRRVVGTDLMTVSDVCDELKIARSTFYEWRTKGRGPRCTRLPNGALRIRRRDLESWLADCEDRP